MRLTTAKGRILAQQDPPSNITRYTYDDFGNRTSITEPLGWRTLFAYDSRANVIARTNALGEVTRWTFHPFFNKATSEINPLGWTNSYVLDNTTGNLLRHSDDLGTLVSYSYTINGLVDTAMDANGKPIRFFYGTNGFLIRKLDAAGFATTYGYNELGWKTAETNALRQAVTRAFDLNGNVIRTVDPLQRVFARTVDANGNVTSEFDAKGNFTSNVFDLANQKVSMTDRTRTNAFTYAYNSRGKVERVTDPLGNSTTNFYDNANRLIRITDPLGNSVQREYDANGNEVAMTDKVGQRWTKAYDRLNRVIAESNPQGNTRRTTFDAAGRIQQVFTPLGYPSTHAYDGRGRLTNWIDPENFAWRYTYDGNANIVDIEDVIHGHYVMSYGPRNERLTERNQDADTWQYTYDALLRLKEQHDPNGTVRTMEYDAGGRLRRVRFNTGRINSLSYDANDNPTELERIDADFGGVSSILEYDAMDRLTRYSDDVTFYDVEYVRDALGRAASITYPGGQILSQHFDALGRLTGQAFAFDANRRFTNTYAYDNADRLIRRTYPNGVIQSNAFDTAGRMTALSHSALDSQPSTLNLALTYAYDRNGNKTAATEKGTLDWNIPPLTDELANYTAAGKLKARTIETNNVPPLNSQSSTINYLYDRSGNLTNATGNGQSWALTYDEDNRTTSIRWTTNGQTTAVLNRYDALGRRVSRSLNGNETAYALDVSGSMERILCDFDAIGTITAWYIHGPDLVFKVNADSTLTCFHADAQANIIALSGTDGTVVAQYAFSPYGRSFSSTNLESANSNPYLFVGSQGVMEELPGLYFMRARYYSAELGVFLSTDPVKRIGPGWKSNGNAYVNQNPLSAVDPNGKHPVLLPALIASLVLADMILESIDLFFADADNRLKKQMHQMSETQFQTERASDILDIIPLGRFSKWLKIGADVAVAMNNHDGLSLVPVISPYRSIINHVDSIDKNVRLKKAQSNTPVASTSARTITSYSASSALNSSQSVLPKAAGASTHLPQSNATGRSTSSGPSSTPDGGSSTTYTVRSGDTLGNIGYVHGTTAAAIGAANRIANLNLIHPGQVLTIPRR